MSRLAKKHDGDQPVSIAIAQVDRLHEVWKGVEDAGYPPTYQGVTTKSLPLLEALGKLAGRNILDIGCNSGFYSLAVGRVAHSVCGCDLGGKLIARANAGKDYFDENVYSTHNVRFVNSSFLAQLNDNIDAIMASCVLYHIGDEAVSRLGEFLARSDSKVVLQTRPQRREAFAKHPEWGSLANTKAYGGLFTVEDSLSFLRDCGYGAATVSGLAEEFYGERFPVIYAEK